MELKNEDFLELKNYIHKTCGIHINESKKYLVQQRLSPVAQSLGLESFRKLIQKLENDSALGERIVESITTNETSFFRDDHPFGTFGTMILPKLGELIRKRKERQNNMEGPKVNLWCAASSTGQEPYSLSMLISEYVDSNKYNGISIDDFSILATDISSEVLSQAISGEYSNLEVRRGLSDERKKKYFIKREPDGWILSGAIRGMVDFRKINLAESFTTLGRFDVIICRNVLIYFDDHTKGRIFSQFRKMLSDDGLLVLGACENVRLLTDEFESFTHGQTIMYRPKTSKAPR